MQRSTHWTAPAPASARKLASTGDGARLEPPTITIGFLGAFATFSTLSLETYRLIDRGHFIVACAYSLGSLAAGLAALSAGVLLARSF